MLRKHKNVQNERRNKRARGARGASDASGVIFISPPSFHTFAFANKMRPRCGPFHAFGWTPDGFGSGLLRVAFFPHVQRAAIAASLQRLYPTENTDFSFSRVDDPYVQEML